MTGAMIFLSHIFNVANRFFGRSALGDTDEIKHKFLREQSPVIEPCITETLLPEPLERTRKDADIEVKIS